MTNSASTGSWFPDEKRNNVEFFKKLHMLRDDLHIKEMENMKSAVARMESKRYRRSNKSIEKEKKDRAKFDKNMFNNRLSDGSEFVGMRPRKGGSLFEYKDAALMSWETRKSRVLAHSGSLRSNENRPHYKLKTQSIALKGGQFKLKSQTQSDTRIPSLTDNTIARIATNLNDFDGHKTYDFMRNPDHLPSIPSVGHRVSITHKNRLKAMTWESEFSEPSKITKKEVNSKANALTSKALHETTRIGKESLDKKKHEGLRFAVNLKDKEVFKHLNREVLPSTPSSPGINQTVNAAYPNIPLISLPIETITADDDSLGSARSGGELEYAMRKLVKAHENFENLKEELEDIAHTNDQLEGLEEFCDSSKEM